MFAPVAVVDVFIHAPGPIDGYFADKYAHDHVELTTVTSGFALGRPVDHPLGLSLVRDDSRTEMLDGKRGDGSLGTLARKGVPLDIVGLLARGDWPSFRRLRNALVTFDAAQRQERDAVACLLYVAAAECLAAPITPWRKEKLTKRFLRFFEELVPSHLDAIVSHTDFEATFDTRRGQRSARVLRRKLLDRMYDYRSGQIHEGIDPGYQGSGRGAEPLPSPRRGLITGFAESAILAYLKAPRSSLVGHPDFETTPEAE